MEWSELPAVHCSLDCSTAEFARALESRGSASMGRERRACCGLTFLGSPKGSDTLQSEVGAVQCLSLCQCGNGSIACCLWKNPGREGILCSWVGAGECPCSFCCPALSPYSHVPPCALCQICAPGQGLSSCLATEKPSVSWARGAPALQ